MAIKHCPKLNSGELEYEFNEESRYVRLTKDYPGKGYERGGRFDSSTVIPFEEINRILKQKSSLKTRDLAHLFVRNLSNNGPMLTAVLVNENLLRKEANGSYRVMGTL